MTGLIINIGFAQTNYQAPALTDIVCASRCKVGRDKKIKLVMLSFSGHIMCWVYDCAVMYLSAANN